MNDEGKSLCVLKKKEGKIWVSKPSKAKSRATELEYKIFLEKYKDRRKMLYNRE